MAYEVGVVVVVVGMGMGGGGSEEGRLEQFTENRLYVVTFQVYVVCHIHTRLLYKHLHVHK